MMDIKKFSGRLYIVLFFITITMLSGCEGCKIGTRRDRTISELRPSGKIKVSVLPSGKTTFQVGDTIFINSTFNAKDLDHWSLYKAINNFRNEINIYLLDPNPKNNTYGRVPSGSFYTTKTDTVFKKNAVYEYEFISKGSSSRVSTDPFGFTYQKNINQSYSIKIMFILKKAGEYILGGDNYLSGYDSYTKYMAHNKALATDSISRRFAASVRVYAEVKKRTEHGLVPVIFTNNGKNYLPIKVLE